MNLRRKKSRHDLLSIAPYPYGWARNIDMCPSLSLQERLDPRQEVLYMKGVASVSRQVTIPEGRISDLNIEITRVTMTGNKVQIKFGVPDPLSEERVLQRELWDDLTSRVPEFDDIVIQERITEHGIPRELEDFRPLDGAESIFNVELHKADHHRRFRKYTGFPVISLYRIVKPLLLKYGVPSTDPALRRITKNALWTQFTFPSNQIGYYPLRDVNLTLQRALRGDKFWQDTALPIETGVVSDGTRDIGYLYRLDRSGVLIGV